MLPVAKTTEDVMYGRFPVATILLILINVVVHIVVVFHPNYILPYAISASDIYRELGVVPIAIVRGEKLWTLFTSMFLHGDFYHLLGNMLFLYFFGGAVENAMGSKRFLLFYFISGLFAHYVNILVIYFIPQEYLLTNYGFSPWTVPAIGASGAISGVMGAYLIYYPRTKLSLVYFIAIIPLFVTLPAWAYISLWFLTQLILGILVLVGLTYSSIAFWAHIGGFMAGVVLAPFFLSPRVKAMIRTRRVIEKYELIIPPEHKEAIIEEAGEEAQ